jgi:hypothetical protein
MGFATFLVIFFTNSSGHPAYEWWHFLAPRHFADPQITGRQIVEIQIVDMKIATSPMGKSLPDRA